VPGTPARPRSLRRPVIVPRLTELRGPRYGTIDVPKRLYWSGDENCGHIDLSDEDQAALAYESIINSARSTADLTAYLNAELLARFWPTLGISLDRKRQWVAVNPVLGGETSVAA
jgi:hypothetical protein